MDKKLKSALKESFTPPQAQKRDKFLNSISMPKAKFSEVLFFQIGFIRKRVWFTFILCVCTAFFYVNMAEISENITSTISALLPLFVLCITSEINKSVSHNMIEMELACKYNLSKITLMRTGILGIVSFVMLLIFVAIARNSDYGMLRCIIYLAVPFLLSSYLSLLVIMKLQIKETIYVCGGICSSISTFIILASNSYNFIYNVNFTYLWLISFFILSFLLVHYFIRFIKSQEELQWNLA